MKEEIQSTDVRLQLFINQSFDKIMVLVPIFIIASFFVIQASRYATMRPWRCKKVKLPKPRTKEERIHLIKTMTMFRIIKHAVELRSACIW